jgi:cytochrome c oxidase assembly factor CtaG
MAWSWHPAVIALCAVALAGYARLRRFRFSGGSLFLLAAAAVFFFALASPIAVLADGYLFSAHMLQHLLLQLVVPPLVLLSFRTSDFGLRPPHAAPPAPSASPPLWLKPLSAVLTRPLVTWFLGLSAMWLWHVPSLCSASATNPWVHLLQGVSLLLMGAAFWWPIIGPWRCQWLPPLIGILYLFSACVGCTILGIILTFAPLGVCPVFMHPVDRLGILPLLQDNWGLTPAKDQQLGGLLMWVPPCFVYLCGIFGLLVRWYAGPDPEIATSADSAPGASQPGLGPAHPLREET